MNQFIKENLSSQEIYEVFFDNFLANAIIRTIFN